MLLDDFFIIIIDSYLTSRPCLSMLKIKIIKLYFILIVLQDLTLINIGQVLIECRLCRAFCPQVKVK